MVAVFSLGHVCTNVWEPGLKTESKNACFRMPFSWLTTAEGELQGDKVVWGFFAASDCKTFLTDGVNQPVSTRK